MPLDEPESLPPTDPALRRSFARGLPARVAQIARLWRAGHEGDQLAPRRAGRLATGLRHAAEAYGFSEVAARAAQLEQDLSADSPPAMGDAAHTLVALSEIATRRCDEANGRTGEPRTLPPPPAPRVPRESERVRTPGASGRRPSGGALRRLWQSVAALRGRCARVALVVANFDEAAERADVSRALERMSAPALVASFGATSLLVVFPDLGHPEAQMIVERAIASRQARAATGAATLPDDGDSLAQVVCAADARLDRRARSRTAGSGH